MSDEQTTKQESILLESTFNNITPSFELDNKSTLFFKQKDKTTSLKQDEKSIFLFLRLCLLNFFYLN
jgi:hypothetical protein